MTVGWSTSAFADVAELVRERTGMIFTQPRQPEVEATIRRTMARLRIDTAEELLTLLRDDARVRESFVADLTIGESYFQRDPLQFELLRTRVLPELLAGRTSDRPVRVWSAGCASGEEPYTIAMLFEELDAAECSDIVGTDISRSRLADAQRGLYSQWQLRNTAEPVRRRYFAPHGKFFELSPRIRQRVDFRYLNLAEDSFPSLAAGIWGMDVIMCRNVLIYFDTPTVERVARRLVGSLSEDGWLLLGASDPAISEFVECDVILTDAGLVYRRPGAAGAEDIRGAVAGREPYRPEHTQPDELTAARADDQQVDSGAFDAGSDAGPVTFDPVPSALDADDVFDSEPEPERAAGAESARDVPDAVHSDRGIIDAYAARDFQRVQELARASAPAQLGVAGWTAWVRALANEGRHAEAGDTVVRALESVGPTPELLYLHAVLLLQTGNAADASAAARRALYLDRSLVVAHLTLGEAQRRLGNDEGERRALRNAAALLSALDPSEHVAASDGEAAGRLAELVRVKLALLTDSA